MPSENAPTRSTVQSLLKQLDEIEHGAGGGVLQIPGGERLEVSNLGKPFWPGGGADGTRPARRPGPSGPGTLTKGDLFRHYVRVAPLILPVLADRPLVMKRYPNGIAASPFYQHRAPDKVPPGVRIEKVTTGSETRPHLVGGSLVTLLYTAQLASISQDPWFSRVGSAGMIDHAAIDLDPPDGLPYARVLDVARWVRDELATLKVPGFAKTSGAGGLHVYVPMPPATPYPAGFLFAQIVATMVANKHPKLATIERSLKARGRRIYVDYMQNALGKTLASAYSARSSDFAGVSTPITWDEVEAGVSPKDFTIGNFAERIESAGDPWEGLRKAKGVDLSTLKRATEARKHGVKKG
jgi:bifunctional non-homologous end joining protein LigD